MNVIIDGLVSVIIPVRNRAHLVLEAINSVRDQTYPNWEVVVADDVSSDDTPDRVAALAQSDTRIRLVRRTGCSGGPGVAREAARLEARGEFIQYLDSDDLVLPNKFEAQVNLLRTQKSVQIVYGWTKIQALDGTISSEPGKATGECHDRLFPKLLVDRWWFTSTPLYRRALTDKIGPWPTIRWGQDWAYDSIAGGMNVTLATVNEYVSIHRHHKGDRQTGEFDWFAGEKLIAYHELQRGMLKGALKAGIAPAVPEMVHFARLQFKIARSFAAEGNIKLANQAMQMVAAAYGGQLPLDVRIYRALSRMGPRFVGRLAVLRDRRPWSQLPP